MSELKESNPKKIYGIAKPSSGFVSPIAETWLSIAMQEGAGKYGPFNWRDKPVDVSTYYSAARRHWALFFSGETHDPKTGVHHLAYAMACAAIVIDAQEVGSLIDDRPSDHGIVSRLISTFTKEPAEAAPAVPVESAESIVDSIAAYVPRRARQIADLPPREGTND